MRRARAGLGRREESEIRLGMRGFWDCGIKGVAAQDKTRQKMSDRSWQKKVGGEKGRV